MVNFDPSTSLRSGSSLSNLSHFKELQDTAKKEFGLQSVIFRDSLTTAEEVITVLRDLKERGYDLSGISVMVSEKASRKKTRKELGFKEGDTPTIINENFQSCKHLFPAELQLETNPANQKKLIESLRFGGFTTPTFAGNIQKPLVTLEPNHQQIKTDLYSTNRIDHVVYHEFMHALHFKELLSGIQRQRQPQAVKLPETPYNYIPEAYNFIVELITHEVGQYAGTDFLEFVAEYSVFKMFNPSYVNQKLDELYRWLKGPEIRPKPSKL